MWHDDDYIPDSEVYADFEDGREREEDNVDFFELQRSNLIVFPIELDLPF